MTDDTLTYEQYRAIKDAELLDAIKKIEALRLELDALTRGRWEDGRELTFSDQYRLDQAAFVAMNAHWDFGSAIRALQGARDRLVRD